MTGRLLAIRRFRRMRKEMNKIEEIEAASNRRMDRDREGVVDKRAKEKNY